MDDWNDYDYVEKISVKVKINSIILLKIIINLKYIIKYIVKLCQWRKHKIEAFLNLKECVCIFKGNRGSPGQGGKTGHKGQRVISNSKYNFPIDLNLFEF